MISKCPSIVKIEVDFVIEQRASEIEEVSIDEAQICEGSDSVVVRVSWNRFKDMGEELRRKGGEGRCVR